MPSVAQNTLYIQEGACNPRAIARELLRAISEELVRAVDEACNNGGSPAAGKSPEVRLILHQLLWILYGTDVAVHDYQPTCGCAIFRNGHGGCGWDWDKDMAAVRAKVEADKCIGNG